MERKLHFITAELKKEEIDVPLMADLSPGAPPQREMIDLEAKIERDLEEIKELTENSATLEENYRELVEFKYALEKSKYAFENNNLEGIDDLDDSHPLDFVVGVMSRERFLGFERMLWRISRGNIFVRQHEIDETFKDPRTKQDMHKLVFVLFFQGEQLRRRVRKICEGYHATLYPCPHEIKEWAKTYDHVKIRLADLTTVLNQTKDHRDVIMNNIGRNLTCWRIMVKKMKSIYHCLNYFNMDLTNRCMIGECWVATRDIPSVQRVLETVTSKVNSEVKSFLQIINTNETPPTYMHRNKFTSGFQTLIDSYGIASYREVNPAFFTLATFPFLFGMMFGDIGHGLLVLIFGAWMVLFEQRLSKWKIGEIWTIFFGGRYIILLMGFFSIFAGFMYNDCFGKSFNIFGSSWFINRNESTVLDNELLQLNPIDETTKRVYPLGLDPVWMMAENKIVFQNSVKMKLSVIIGVTHMIFGVCMQIPNHIELKRYWNILLDFVPQIVFLVSLFGYLVFMMIFKWIVYDAQSEDIEKGTSCAPSILIYFIDMMLQRQTVPTVRCTESWMFTAQPMVQKILFAVAMGCIPVLLFGKIIFIWILGKIGVKHHNYNHGDEPMNEMMIYQAIHTIEYVLNCISHTASYLRLWALSLAHARKLKNIVLFHILNFSFYSQNYLRSLGVNYLPCP